MNRTTVAVLATLLLVGGILTVVTASVMRQRATEPTVVTRSWEVPDPSWKSTLLLQDFQLTDRSGKLIGTRELAGNVQVVNFFCIVPRFVLPQNKSVETLLEQFKGQPVKFLSITCNPSQDDPDVLMAYSKKFDAPADQWYFLTGDMPYIARIGVEIFQVHVAEKEHVDMLVVADKWGRRRGSFNWKRPEEMAECKWLIEKLIAEQSPPEPQAENAPATATPPAKKVDEDGDEIKN